MLCGVLLQAFWMPSCGPKGLAVVAPPPDLDTHCPASGKKLRMKDLVQMRFTKVRDGEEGKYMDPVTKVSVTSDSPGSGLPAQPPGQRVWGS